MTKFRIADRWIGENEPTYFIADIAANHDGDLERARKLIYLAKESGADAAKFQNFHAPKLVSDYGFKDLAGRLSHQTKWKKSVYRTYADATLPDEWVEKLKEYCDEVSIHFFSAPYDFEAVDLLYPYVPAYKIGSGDINWPEILEKIAGKGKPVILATEASEMAEVKKALDLLRALNSEVALLQCNTNYTGSRDNFNYLNLNVIGTYRDAFPDVVVGLSDHTPGHLAVLGAVALGARVVEKHFTDDTAREGSDHPFSMDPRAWREMVERTRELEAALGDGVKRLEDNESETVIVQRRCLRAAEDIPTETTLTRRSIDVLRPAPSDAVKPAELKRVIGKKVRASLKKGEHLTWIKIED